MILREETLADRQAIHDLNRTAFDTPLEADLVDKLRQQAQPLISLVAEDAGQITGHILFSPVRHENHPDLFLMGLAPMAVIPEQQNKGIGSRLVTEGLERCKLLSCAAVIVLGHPEYYPRFGFRSASQWGIFSSYEVPDEVFMLLELVPNRLTHCAGKVHFHPAFSDT